MNRRRKAPPCKITLHATPQGGAALPWPRGFEPPAEALRTASTGLLWAQWAATRGGVPEGSRVRVYVTPWHGWWVSDTGYVTPLVCAKAWLKLRAWDLDLATKGIDPAR